MLLHIHSLETLRVLSQLTPHDNLDFGGLRLLRLDFGLVRAHWLALLRNLERVVVVVWGGVLVQVWERIGNELSLGIWLLDCGFWLHLWLLDRLINVDFLHSYGVVFQVICVGLGIWLRASDLTSAVPAEAGDQQFQ